MVLDAGDCVVLPGLVDIRADFNAHPDARGLEIRTRLAAAGGVTAMIDPPVDFGPGPVGAPSFAARLTAIAASIWVDSGFSVPLLPASAERISPLVDCGVFAFKARFGDSAPGSLPPATEPDLRAAMPALARAGRPLVVSVVEEAGPIRVLIDLCRRHACPIHLARVGSAEALGWLVEAREEGLPITVGSLASDFLPSDAPPSTRDRLWDGLRAGLIDAIAPDGPPWGDSTGQPALPGIWAGALRRGFSAEDVARWMSGRPAEWLGLSGRKGAIAIGFDADFVVFDPATTSVEVEATVVRGSIVQFSGRFDGPPRGGVLLRLEETWSASGGLDRLNSLDQDQAVASFLRCRGPARWAEGLASLRPFGSRANLVEAADRAWAALGHADLLQAFAASCCLEDAGDSAPTQSALAEIGRAYARKFGFPLVFHRTGRLALDDLEALRRRLANAPEDEFRLAAEEAARITRRCLGQLFL